MALALVLADKVFVQRIDIGVEIVDNRLNVVSEQPLDDSRGAGCATGMQQDSVQAFGDEYGGLMFTHFV